MMSKLEVRVCACVCTLVVSGFLAVSIDEQFEGWESSDFKLLCQLLLLGGIHLGQTYGRTFLLQFPSSLSVNGLQLFAVTAPGSICTDQLVVSLPEARVHVCVHARVWVCVLPRKNRTEPKRQISSSRLLLLLSDMRMEISS